MCKLLISLCLFVFFWWSSLSFASEGENAKVIMEKSIEAMELKGSESIATLIIKDNKGNERIRKFSSATKYDKEKGITKTIMRFIEPADVKGTGFLIFDYKDKDADMWIYLPSLRKSRRIVSNEKAKNFMGSEFTNADITTPAIEDYKYKIVSKEKIDGTDCWKIEMTPATEKIAEENGISKKIGWIGTSDYITRRTEFYDNEGKLIKIMRVTSVKMVDEKEKKYQATEIIMENIKNGRSSKFVMEKIVLNPEIKDDYFTTFYLEKQ
ncbi:MAG: outer membrane lipoprotein-sorting protein [Chitinispirillaceae bacterium]|nr:outer membrane lipoprotein-sorting protein [Chitinispirillaceae bacterium]